MLVGGRAQQFLRICHQFVGNRIRVDRELALTDGLGDALDLGGVEAAVVGAGAGGQLGGTGNGDLGAGRRRGGGYQWVGVAMARD